MPASDEATTVRLALSNYRDRSFAEIFVIMMGLAAETHPEVLKTALGKVFSVEAIDEMLQRTALVAASTQALTHEMAADVRALTEQIHRDLDRIEARMDALEPRRAAGVRPPSYPVGVTP